MFYSFLGGVLMMCILTSPFRKIVTLISMGSDGFFFQYKFKKKRKAGIAYEEKNSAYLDTFSQKL